MDASDIATLANATNVQAVMIILEKYKITKKPQFLRENPTRDLFIDAWVDHIITKRMFLGADNFDKFKSVFGNTTKYGGEGIRDLVDTAYHYYTDGEILNMLAKTCTLVLNMRASNQIKIGELPS